MLAVGLVQLGASQQHVPAMSGGAQPVTLAQPLSHVHPGCPGPAPARAMSPVHPHGCVQRSPRTRGLQPLLSPFPSLLPVHPASLLPYSASWDASEHPVLKRQGPAPRDSSQAAACTHLLSAPALGTLQPSGFKPRSALAAATAPELEMLLQQRLSCLPTAARSARALSPALPWHPLCRCSLLRCRGASTTGSAGGSCHGTWCTGNTAEPGASHLPAGSPPGQEKPEIP